MKFHFQSGPQHRYRQGIEVTPLSYIPGGRIEQFLGHLNFFIIRETTSVREVCSHPFRGLPILSLPQFILN